MGSIRFVYAENRFFNSNSISDAPFNRKKNFCMAVEKRSVLYDNKTSKNTVDFATEFPGEATL